MTTTQPHRGTGRLAGIPVLETWDYDVARAHAVDSARRLRRDQPDLYRHIRHVAFDMRAELAEHLPGIPTDVIAKVVITVLAKHDGMLLGNGVDPAVVGVVGNITGLAVLDELWPVKA